MTKRNESRLMRPALPERELVFLWAVGWAFSAQGLLVATFEPWIGYVLAAAGWLLLPIGMYRILRRAGYDLAVGSLIVLLVGWLVGLLAIVQAFDSSSVLARSLRDWRPEGELLARYLSIGIAGVAVGFSTSAIVVSDLKKILNFNIIKIQSSNQKIIACNF